MARRGPLLLALVLVAGVLVHPVLADEWPQWRGPRRDGVWREKGITNQLDGERLSLKWSVPIGSGYTGPTVADGRVYVMDRVESPRPAERVLCLDRKTGEEIWVHKYACPYEEFSHQAGPRASVLIEGDRAYSLGATGRLYCLDAATGKVRWHKNLKDIYDIRMPKWGVAASPVIEKDVLITQIGGSDGACLIGLDKKTGEEIWTALSDPASYSAPIVIDQGDKRVVVCFTADRVVGVDPFTGELYWSYDMDRPKWPIAIPSPVRHGRYLFATSIHEGAVLFRLRSDPPAVDEVWRRKGRAKATDGLNSLMCTPYIKGDAIYGVHKEGKLRCIDLTTGKRIWQTTKAVPPAMWSTLHIVGRPNSDRCWLFNERGELIIARLTREGYEEIDRAKLLSPTKKQLSRRGGVTWSHPAFAYKHVFARNDKRIVCADLSAERTNAEQ